MIAVQIICYIGPLACGLISAKMITHWKNWHFINKMLTIYFILQAFFSTGIIFLYFEIIISDGFSQHQVKLCRLYLPVWIIYQHISINGNLGMVFCRFIYVVYAQKLLAAGSRIFHFVLCVGIIVWTVQFW